MPLRCVVCQHWWALCYTTVLLVLLVAMPSALHGAFLAAQPLSGDRLQPCETPVLSAEQRLAFAEQLMREREYFRAITEYRCFLLAFADDSRAAMVAFSIGLAFYHGERYGEAAQAFQDVAQRYPHTAYGQQAWLWQGESLVQQRQQATAEQLYRELVQRFPHHPLRHQARYQHAWVLLAQRHWREASWVLQQIPPDSALYHQAQLLAQESLTGEKLPRKSPVLAGITSSLLPGSGQFYNGRIGDALLAFFLNGLFIAGAIEAVHADAPVVAGVLSLVEAGWYIGNIYGAVNGAHKHNRQVTETFLRNLETRFRLTLPEAGKVSRLSMQWSFGF